MEHADANRTQAGLGSVLGHFVNSLGFGANPEDCDNDWRVGGGGQ